jgi:hypothetical protein
LPLLTGNWKVLPVLRLLLLLLLSLLHGFAAMVLQSCTACIPLPQPLLLRV